ncbi:Mediator of dna damage checkpoint protein [Thalictrum thalictroides]|uniref:Mediator of dna damage checkpoint protein n=1 Tax=Thalictrum thalictroides TaxID=46969 RepID=A0A7J6V861_THATH|nr:Mediator of dna damage checkpoint protein [Thalictrum thalictroides]
MAGENSCSCSPLKLSVGNCKVTVEGSSFNCCGSGGNLEISVASASKINISVEEESESFSSNLSFVLVNPKDADSQSKTLLQEALKVYVKELPAMNYAANTGKESNFLERCVSSGKYCTLLLRLSVGGVFTEVIAALTYQIIPVDTQYAEVPVAAVSSNYQHKGFVIIAKVDAKGKVRRLPIRADIRRALCFPGGSTLMVSHLNKNDNSALNPSKHLESHFLSTDRAIPSSSVSVKTQEPVGVVGCSNSLKCKLSKEKPVSDEVIPQSENFHPQLLVKDKCSTDDKHDGPSLTSCLGPNGKGLASLNAIDCNDSATGLGETKDRESSDGIDCSCSMQSAKRKTWETSLSSIKSKKVKGGQHISCSSGDHSFKHDKENNSCFKACSTSFSKDNLCKEVVPNDSMKNINSKDQFCMDFVPKYALGNGRPAVQTAETEPLHVIANENRIEKILPRGECHRIMLMDIADDAKKTSLTQIIENLGGAMASDGSLITHVITGKARKTQNFCVALCSGAWVLSSNWLKVSYRQGRFVDELPFILQDEDYLLKYKSELKDVVLRAKAHSRALLKGYDICLAKHVQPPVKILSDIIKSAGGNVVRSLSKVREPSKTIFVACDENMEEAMTAAKRGILTFSSEWFMSCVMRQELDMQAPQFAESL